MDGYTILPCRLHHGERARITSFATGEQRIYDYYSQRHGARGNILTLPVSSRGIDKQVTTNALSRTEVVRCSSLRRSRPRSSERIASVTSSWVQNEVGNSELKSTVSMLITQLETAAMESVQDGKDVAVT